MTAACSRPKAGRAETVEAHGVDSDGVASGGQPEFWRYSMPVVSIMRVQGDPRELTAAIRQRFEVLGDRVGEHLSSAAQA